jgi:hypothetical protein
MLLLRRGLRLHCLKVLLLLLWQEALGWQQPQAQVKVLEPPPLLQGSAQFVLLLPAAAGMPRSLILGPQLVMVMQVQGMVAGQVQLHPGTPGQMSPAQVHAEVQG